MERTAVVVAGLVVALAAGVRGVWSPCGLSMLSTITPMGEAGRGRRFAPTARWYVVGAACGGMSLGAVLAAAAWGVATWDPGGAVTTTAVAVAAAVAMASDARVGGFSLPVHRRQVNERWLDQYRPWVYGAGFGWQIGTGFCTYIVTAANYLLVVLAASSRSPVGALAMGVLFGLVRGLAVLAARNLRTFEALQACHSWLQRTGPFVRDVTIGVEGAAALVVVGVRWPAAVALLALGEVAVFAATVPQRQAPACSLDARRR